MEFKCANKECIPWSYRCDSYHDCGCEDQGCDEIDCGGLNLSSDTKVAIGVGVGIFVFILTFVGLGLLDICMKMRADRKYQETIEKQKRLQKQRKAMAMAKLLVTQSSTDGSRMSANTSGLLRVSSTNTMNASLLSIIINVVPDCPMEFKCANKECIPWSYRCDSYHDCGCEDQGCDEIDCGGLNLSSDTKVAIGVGVGIFVFILTFVGLGLLDICMKMRADRKYQETIEKQKRLQKQRKAMAMAKLLVTQSSTDGSRMSANTSGLLRVSSTNTMNASLVSVKN
ncbi:hypothetical protein LSH36_11g13076 [Paralvinella palmiformis]|uniref:Uncharacterized protein n=1 Tax=Paralvinella palmiformis TaxID=53620 RepID=A0AAD9NIB0_9ANNE|nr:hypothetical protein LSH36_11g13076 [Paralvinella palmiformis]